MVKQNNFIAQQGQSFQYRTMITLFLAIIIVSCGLPHCDNCYLLAQSKETTDQKSTEAKEQEKSDSASMRGKIDIPEAFKSVSFEGMEVVLEEKVNPPKLPLPKNFMEMELKDRQKWYQDFLKTDEGKAYQKKAQELQKNRRILKSKIDKAGKFQFKKVPYGTYFLQGNKDFSIEGKKYVAGIFGEIPVKDVKHVELDRMPLDVLRILAKGDQTPDLRLKVLESGKEQVVKIEQFAGKRTLLYFWTIQTAKHANKEINEVAKVVNEGKLNVALIGINLDEDEAKVKKFLEEKSFLWNSVQSSGIETAPVVQDFGISAIPSIWLIDSNGKIELTEGQILQAMSGKETRTLLSVLQDVEAGKEVLPKTEKK